MQVAMKQSTVLYKCRVKNSRVYLHIEHWLVADYPLTFTSRECLEEFCESVGWRFISCYGNKGVEVYALRYYDFLFERSLREDIGNTIMEACYAHEGRPVEEMI